MDRECSVSLQTVNFLVVPFVSLETRLFVLAQRCDAHTHTRAHTLTASTRTNSVLQPRGRPTSQRRTHFPSANYQQPRITRCDGETDHTGNTHDAHSHTHARHTHTRRGTFNELATNADATGSGSSRCVYRGDRHAKHQATHSDVVRPSHRWSSPAARRSASCALPAVRRRSVPEGRELPPGARRPRHRIRTPRGSASQPALLSHPQRKLRFQRSPTERHRQRRRRDGAAAEHGADEGAPPAVPRQRDAQQCGGYAVCVPLARARVDLSVWRLVPVFACVQGGVCCQHERSRGVAYGTGSTNCASSIVDRTAAAAAAAATSCTSVAEVVRRKWHGAGSVAMGNIDAREPHPDVILCPPQSTCRVRSGE